MPCFDAVTSKMARNQSASGFLLCSKIVPAITDTWRAPISLSTSGMHDLPRKRPPTGSRGRPRKSSTRTRPTWHNGKVYVATMDYSKIDAGYLERRGFHWYVYDPAIGAFTDLSATEPGGVGAARL